MIISEDLKWEFDEKIREIDNSTFDDLSQMQLQMSQLNDLSRILKGEEIEDKLEILTELEERIVILKDQIKNFIPIEKRKLTKELAFKKVAEIADSSDDESQHIKEDELYFWFITSVSNGCYEMDEAIEIAKIIKQVDDLDFCRWYA
jgi:vacuolar-type H+-ATPase subunit I/STV1